VLPSSSAQEACVVSNSKTYQASHLVDVAQNFSIDPQIKDASSTIDLQRLDYKPPSNHLSKNIRTLDLKEVKGHSFARRALEIAAAGGHSLLMTGPPGSGKSMLAQRLIGLLPPMDLSQMLDSAAVACLRPSSNIQT
jgi:magnesium chelatase family protein